MVATFTDFCFLTREKKQLIPIRGYPSDHRKHGQTRRTPLDARITSALSGSPLRASLANLTWLASCWRTRDPSGAGFRVSVRSDRWWLRGFAGWTTCRSIEIPSGFVGEDGEGVVGVGPNDIRRIAPARLHRLAAAPVNDNLKVIATLGHYEAFRMCRDVVVDGPDGSRIDVPVSDSVVAVDRLQAQPFCERKVADCAGYPGRQVRAGTAPRLRSARYSGHRGGSVHPATGTS